MRMLQREMEKEDTKSSRKRKEAKHNYAAKVPNQIRNTNTENNSQVLGNLGTLGEVRRRPGVKEGHGEGVVGKRRDERKRVKEDEDEVTEVESKTKRSKRSVAAEEEGSGRSKRVKSAKRRDLKKPGKD